MSLKQKDKMTAAQKLARKMKIKRRNELLTRERREMEAKLSLVAPVILDEEM